MSVCLVSGRLVLRLWSLKEKKKTLLSVQKFSDILKTTNEPMHIFIGRCATAEDMTMMIKKKKKKKNNNNNER